MVPASEAHSAMVLVSLDIANTNT